VHLPAFCAEHSIDLIAQSFIQFSAVPFEVKKPFEVVFFGSVRAASFFLSSYSLPKGVEIACIGETTAEKLSELSLEVSFVGTKAGNPTEVGEDFKAWLGDRRVLFPISSVSKESIVKVVPENQSEKVIVYDTRAKESQLVNLDLAIFTSPSNLESFLLAGNKVPQLTIAWGNTTFQAMIASEIQATSTLANSTELELISVLNKLITQ